MFPQSVWESLHPRDWLRLFTFVPVKISLCLCEIRVKVSLHLPLSIAWWPRASPLSQWVWGCSLSWPFVNLTELL